MIKFWGELALAKLLILKWDLLQYLYTLLAICVLLLHLYDGVRWCSSSLFHTVTRGFSFSSSFVKSSTEMQNHHFKTFYFALGSSYLFHRHGHDDPALRKIEVGPDPYFSACFFSRKQCFSLTTNQPEQCFSLFFQRSERAQIYTNSYRKHKLV